MFFKRVTLFGIILSTALVLSASGSQFQFEYEKFIDIDDFAEIVISNSMGEVIIEGSDNSGIYIKAFKIIGAETSEEAERLAEYVKIDIKQKSSLVNISTEFKFPQNNKSFLESLFGSKEAEVEASINFTLTVPMNSRVELNGKSTDLEVANIGGDIYIINGDGNIILSDITGDLVLETIDGSVKIDRLVGSIEMRTGVAGLELSEIIGPVNIKSISGGKNLGKIKGNLHLEQSSGDCRIIDLTGNLSITSATGKVAAEQGSGSFNIESSKGDINLKTMFETTEKSTIRAEAGDIYLAIPEHCGANLRIESKTGRIKSRIPIKSDSASPGKVIGTIGEGGVEINMWTETGTINLSGF